MTEAERDALNYLITVSKIAFDSFKAVKLHDAKNIWIDGHVIPALRTASTIIRGKGVLQVLAWDVKPVAYFADPKQGIQAPTLCWLVKDQEYRYFSRTQLLAYLDGRGEIEMSREPRGDIAPYKIDAAR